MGVLHGGFSSGSSTGGPLWDPPRDPPGDRAALVTELSPREAKKLGYLYTNSFQLLLES